MRLRALFAAALSLAPAAACAAFDAAARGTESARFLRVGVGARALALGEAYTAVADDASAVHWNPAALTRIERRSATFEHSTSLGSGRFDYLSYGQRLSDRQALGADVKYFTAGKVVETDVSGNETGTFTPYDLSLALAYARQLEAAAGPFEGFSAGVAGKFVQSRILKTATAAAFDAGILSPAHLDGRLRWGLSAANLGTSLKYESQRERLPLAFRAGAALAASPAWTLALDVGLPRGGAPEAALGAEYLAGVSSEARLALRAGLNTRALGEVSGIAGLSTGVGFLFRDFGVDYALLPVGGLGIDHRLGLTARF